MEFLKEIYERFKADSPKFFRKLMYIGGVIGTIGTGILIRPDSVPMPEFLEQIAGYMAAVGYTVTLISNLPKKDQNDPTN